MDPTIQQTITGYTGIFDSLNISDAALAAEVAQFRQDFNELGESSSDVMDFMGKMQSSGVQERYSSLISRASAPPPAAAGGGEAASTPKKLPTVEEFLNQYRASYDEVKKAGYRKRAEKAYEAIFAVAGRTDDLLEMNIILEKERLLWKIVSEDFIDIYEPIRDATDPLNLAQVAQFERLIKACTESQSDEALSYLTDIAIQENQQYTYRFMLRMIAALMLSKSLMEFEIGKRRLQSWMQPEKDLRGLIALREAVRSTHAFLKETWGWDFDTMTRDEWMKAWMLVPTNIDVLGRIRRCLDPHNLDAMRELLFEEVLSDKPIEDIILHEQNTVLYFALNNRDDEVLARYTEAAKQRNANLVYFQYQERIQASAAAAQIKVPEAKAGTSV